MSGSRSARVIDRLQLALPLFQGAPALAAPVTAGLRLERAEPPPAPAPHAPTPNEGPRERSRTRALIEAIERRVPGCRVVLTDNRSVLLSQQHRNGEHVVRVHQMFLDAPPDVREATAHYLARGDRASGAVVDAFIDAQAHLLTMAARPLAPDAHAGTVHGLLPIYDELNDRYFQQRIAAEIGWGRAGRESRRARTSITFGSYDHRARRIIIHPVLDQVDVPRLVVARVVHHEMLHQKHGEQRDAGGRRVVHGRAFRLEEARFEGAREADGWIEAHMDALLRFRRRAPVRRL